MLMRAAVIDRTGDPDVFHIAQVTAPHRISAEFLVRVHAAGINPIDTKTRAGGGTSAAIAAFPAVLGHDFSGTVLESPDAAHPIRPGDEVFGMIMSPRFSGSFGEIAAVPSLSVARKPATLGHVEAAAVPIAALTAWRCVTELASAAPGRRVLIHAAAGGVGHFAVQFAHHLGAHVIATSSASHADFVRSLGADEVVDYRRQRFEEVIDPVDAVIDLIGNVHDDTGTRSLGVLKPGGLIVNVPTGSWPSFFDDVARAGVRGTDVKVAPDARVLAKIGALIDEGTVRVHLEEVFNLADMGRAHELVETGHVAGKVAVRIAREE
ncbi:MAG TPA: NADP-dependent oxidoreductase [Microbacteriaceae bacterium]|nr:NADP-dependent oxidoreductase [Microbacteriaceae bacterium]